MKVVHKLFNYIFYSSNQRTQLVKRNILGMTSLKGVSVLISFMLVPMTINYLNPTEYGIWLTLNSILTWTNVFDFGLGFGLRNKIAEAYAMGDLKKIKTYVSTAFLVLTFIAIFIFTIFGICNNFIKWDELLNIDPAVGNNLSVIAIWVIFFFCIQFVLRIIDVIIVANQRSALSALISVAGSVFTLLMMCILIHSSEASLFNVALIFTAVPVMTYAIFSLVLFSTRYKLIKPSIKCIDLNCMKDILGLGSKFFIIQLSTLLVFTSSNLIISRNFGPQDVTVYNVVYKYFSTAIMSFAILTSPLWSAYTDAYAKGDFDWIRHTTEKMRRIWVYSVIFILFLLFFSKLFYEIWIGDALDVPFSLSFFMAIYAILLNLHSIYVYVINGTGKIRIVFYISIISLFIFVPISLYLCALLGLNGTVIATIAILLPLFICVYIQYNKIVTQTDIGIWSK